MLRYSTSQVPSPHSLNVSLFIYSLASSVHLGRTILKDFTFADGTCVPTGSTIYVNSRGVHADEGIVKGGEARVFDGFRWCSGGGTGVDQHEEEKEKDGSADDGVKHGQPMLMKPTLEYHAFGYGKHAW